MKKSLTIGLLAMTAFLLSSNAEAGPWKSLITKYRIESKRAVPLRKLELAPGVLVGARPPATPGPALVALALPEDPIPDFGINARNDAFILYRGEDHGVFLLRCNDGFPCGAAERVGSSGGRIVAHPIIAVHPLGHYFAAWNDLADDGPSIRALVRSRRYPSSSSEDIDGGISISSGLETRRFVEDVSINRLGDGAVLWLQEERIPDWDPAAHITGVVINRYQHRYPAESGWVGPEVIMSASDFGTPDHPEEWHFIQPRAAMDKDGNIVVVAALNRPIGGTDQFLIVTRTYTPGGGWLPAHVVAAFDVYATVQSLTVDYPINRATLIYNGPRGVLLTIKIDSSTGDVIGDSYRDVGDCGGDSCSGDSVRVAGAVDANSNPLVLWSDHDGGWNMSIKAVNVWSLDSPLVELARVDAGHEFSFDADLNAWGQGVLLWNDTSGGLHARWKVAPAAAWRSPFQISPRPVIHPMVRISLNEPSPREDDLWRVSATAVWTERDREGYWIYLHRFRPSRSELTLSPATFPGGLLPPDDCSTRYTGNALTCCNAGFTISTPKWDCCVAHPEIASDVSLIATLCSEPPPPPPTPDKPIPRKPTPATPSEKPADPCIQYKIDYERACCHYGYQQAAGDGSWECCLGRESGKPPRDTPCAVPGSPGKTLAPSSPGPGKTPAPPP